MAGRPTRSFESLYGFCSVCIIAQRGDTHQLEKAQAGLAVFLPFKVCILLGQNGVPGRKRKGKQDVLFRQCRRQRPRLHIVPHKNDVLRPIRPQRVQSGIQLKADFSSLSPIIIIEESNLQTFLHSLGRHMLCLSHCFCPPDNFIPHPTI